MKNSIKKTIVVTGLVASLSMTALPLTQASNAIHADSINMTVNNNNGDNNVNSSSSVSATSSSDNDGHAVQTHELQKSYIVFGSGLSSSQRQSVENVLVGNGGNPQNFTNLVANAQDYNEYINNGQPSNTTDASMISSVAIEPADPGSGINVTIKDYDGDNNIQQVTAQQYAMAAQMAGVTDVNIVVTANTPVSGTSALTGVYEALAQDGEKLDNQNTAAANNVLAATQQATKGMSNANKSKVVQATTATAQQIAKDNQNGDHDSQTDIQNMLQHNINKQNVNISGNNISIIANALNGFKNAPVAHTKTFIDGADDTLSNLKKSAGNAMIKADDWAKANKGFLTRLWNRIKNWFETNVMHKNPAGNIQSQNESNDNQTTNSSTDDSSSAND